MKSITRAIFSTSLVALGLASAIGPVEAQKFPSKPVEISVWAAAGGGTDTVNRMIAKAMEKDLGGAIIVSNRTGGGGAVAMNHVWSRPHDGYNWLGSSEQMQIVATMGFHGTTTRDWRWYMVAGAPGVLSVKPDSRFKSLDDLVAAARANPGKVNIAHSPIASVWHAKALGLAGAIEAKLNSVPYAGSAPAMVAVLAGDGDAVISSLAEQTEYIKTGKLRPLAMVETVAFDFPGLGRIPAVGEKYPNIAKMPARTWLGFGVPAKTPGDIIAKIDQAFAAALKDPAFKDTMEKMNYTVIGAYGDESMKILSAMESAVSWALFDLGAAKISPDSKGIPRP